MTNGDRQRGANQSQTSVTATTARTRRGFLAATAGTALAGLAGCLGGSDGGSSEMESDHDSATPASNGSSSSATPSGQSGSASLSHASAANVENEPRLGPPVGESEGVIVAFEDPSCPACRRFEQQTFPDLQSKLFDPGKATFFYRTFPHVQAWARPATNVLEATYENSDDAFWSLKDHYYDNLDSFSTDNVYDESKTFLAAETSVDADAVVQAARNGEYESRIEADMNVVREAGVDSTPTFFLFRGTEFVSSVVGNQSVSVFTNALGI